VRLAGENEKDSLKGFWAEISQNKIWSFWLKVFLIVSEKLVAVANGENYKTTQQESKRAK
jgi:hypothetical protein